MKTLIFILICLNILFFLLLIKIYKKINFKLMDLKKRLYDLPKNQKKIESLFSIYNSIDLDVPINRLNGFTCSPDLLHEIVSLIFKNKPQLFVEFGSGVSTIIIGKALQKLGSGKIISFEHLEHEYKKTNIEIKSHGLDKICTCVYAPLKEIDFYGNKYNWYSINDNVFKKNIDMILIDGPPINTSVKESRFPALPQIIDFINEDSLILLDDANRLDEKNCINKWKEIYPQVKSNYISLERGLAIIKLK